MSLTMSEMGITPEKIEAMIKIWTHFIQDTGDWDGALLLDIFQHYVDSGEELPDSLSANEWYLLFVRAVDVDP